MNNLVPHPGLFRAPAHGRPRINLQITRDSRGQVRVVQPDRLPNDNILKSKPDQRKRGKPILIERGSAVVRIYGKKPGPWTIAWREYSSGPRLRTMRSDLAKATALAEEKATALANGDNALLAFSHADRASLEHCRQLVARTGKSIEIICAEYAGLWDKLATSKHQHVPLSELAQVYLEHQPRGAAVKTIPELIAEMLSRKQTCAKWRRVKEKMLERFSKHFTGPLHTLQTQDVDDWLDSLMRSRKGKETNEPITLRSRRNYRDVVEELVTYAKSRGQLSKSWDVMESVSDPDPKTVEVQIYTPEELAYLLGVCERTDAGRKIVPLVCITAFAGVRHGEMNEEKARLLDWADIDFESKSIYIQKDAAKTGRDRMVDMPDNLIAWLKPYAQEGGKMCELENTADALCRQRDKAAREAFEDAEKCAKQSQAAKFRAIAKGLSGPKKNALRKSFISYHNALHRKIDETADQAGNSASIIQKNYKRLDAKIKKDAARWFSLMPQRADVLPLFNWNR